jgi:hypothetical protein
MESANESDRVLYTQGIINDDDYNADCDDYNVDCDDVDVEDNYDDDDRDSFYRSRLISLFSHPSINYLEHQLLIDQGYFGKQQLQVQHLSSMAQEQIY